MTKLLIVLCLNLFLSNPIYAQSKLQKDIKFSVDTNALMKGEVHYAVDIIAPEKLNDKYPSLYDLDSLSILQEPNIEIMIGKSAFIVDKPAGFFDHELAINENYLKHTLGEQQIKKFGDNTYWITVPGKITHSYQLKIYSDSDEISTLPNSKAIRAVSWARKQDVISQSSSATVFKEFTQFTKYSFGGIQVSNHIPIKENKTLILSYSLFAVQKLYALEKVLKSNFKNEAMSQKELISNFK